MFLCRNVLNTLLEVKLHNLDVLMNVRHNVNLPIIDDGNKEESMIYVLGSCTLNDRPSIPVALN